MGAGAHAVKAVGDAAASSVGKAVGIAQHTTSRAAASQVGGKVVTDAWSNAPLALGKAVSDTMKHLPHHRGSSDARMADVSAGMPGWQQHCPNEWQYPDGSSDVQMDDRHQQQQCPDGSSVEDFSDDGLPDAEASQLSDEERFFARGTIQ